MEELPALPPASTQHPGQESLGWVGSSQKPGERRHRHSIPLPILQMRKPRLKKVRCLSQGHGASKWQSRDKTQKV